MNLVPLDIIFIVIIIIAGIRCTFKGFVAEIMAVAAIVLGLGAAIGFCKKLAPYLETYFGQSKWNQIIAFLIIFLVIYLVIKISQGALYKLIDRINLDKLDKSLGFFLGIGEGILVVIAIVFLLKVQPIFETEGFLGDSVIADIVNRILPAAVEVIDKELQDAMVTIKGYFSV